MEGKQGSCAQPGCQAGQGGGCIEGLSFDECPNFVHATSEDVFDKSAGSDSILKSLETVQVSGGEALNMDEASDFRLRNGVYLVAVIAGPEAGKTTFSSALYECIRRNTFGGYGFAGSETLVGFEKRCHLSRMASGRVTPDTERTLHGSPVSFLHLKMADKLTGARYDVMMSDRRGEDFNDVLDTPERIGELQEVVKADCVVVLIDGERCASITTIHTYFSKVRRLVQAAGQNRIFKDKRVQIVLTKYDVASGSPLLEDIKNRLNNLKSHIQEMSDPPSIIDVYEVAARPASQNYSFGFGLEAVVKDWKVPSPKFRAAPLALPNRNFRSLLLERFGVLK